MSIRKGSSIISGSGSSGLPEQAGNAGKILSTDGVTPEWISYNPTPETDGTTISINASDKIQSIGVIEKNNADPKYDWVGTYAEWSSAKANGLIDDDWICYITDDNGTVTSPRERTVGEIIFSLIPQNDPALHLLDGSLIDGTGVYNAFYTYMKNLYDSGYEKCFTSEADWQASDAAYGACGKFVLDVSNQTIRLPELQGFVEGTLDEDALGELMEAGLPNITGGIGLNSGGYGPIRNSGNETGALYKSSNTYNGPQGESQSSGKGFGFDASRSNSIYGNSDTVQPQSIKGFYYIVLTTSVALDVPLDVNAVVNDVTNLQTEIGGADYVVEYQAPTSSNDYTWYRLYKSGWVEQGWKVNYAGTQNTWVNNIAPKTLPIEMEDTNYAYIAPNGAQINNNGWAITVNVGTQSCSFNCYNCNIIGFFEVKGMSKTTS